MGESLSSDVLRSEWREALKMHVLCFKLTSSFKLSAPCTDITRQLTTGCVWENWSPDQTVWQLQGAPLILQPRGAGYQLDNCLDSGAEADTSHFFPFSYACGMAILTHMVKWMHFSSVSASYMSHHQKWQRHLSFEFAYIYKVNSSFRIP